MKRLQPRPLWLALAVAASATSAGASEPNRIYDANCALCHQRSGVGLPGQFPRLAERAGEISATAAGRTYLIEVTLFGMAGKIDVDGAPIIGVMPGFTSLSNEDIASALNYVINLDGPSKSKVKRVPVSAADVEKVRADRQLSPAEVHARREKALAMRKK